MEKFIIAIDTREQKPFTFKKMDPRPKTKKKTLETGDYSIVGLETEITVERKSLSDLFGSCGTGRKRFEREIRRMERFIYAAVVVENDWYAVLRNPPARSQLNPKSVYASIIAWSQRYNIHFWLGPNRNFAERTTFRILDRYYRDIQTGVYHNGRDKF